MAVNPLAQHTSRKNMNATAEVSDAVYDNLTDAQDALRKAKKQIEALNAQLRNYKNKEEMAAFKPKKKAIGKRAKKQFGQGERSR